MTVAATIQERGQVTIPRKIRDKLGLNKGDLVMFVETDLGVVIKPAKLVEAKPGETKEPVDPKEKR